MTPADIRAKIEQTHKDIARAVVAHGGGPLTTPSVLQLHAQMIDLTSQLADISSGRLERLTRHIIFLTWMLVVFTVGLFILTLVLVKHG